MTGHKTKVKNAKLVTDKTGKVKVATVIKFADASAAIRAKNSKKTRYGKLPPI